MEENALAQFTRATKGNIEAIRAREENDDKYHYPHHIGFFHCIAKKCSDSTLEETHLLEGIKGWRKVPNNGWEGEGYTWASPDLLGVAVHFTGALNPSEVLPNGLYILKSGESLDKVSIGDHAGPVGSLASKWCTCKFLEGCQLVFVPTLISKWKGSGWEILFSVWPKHVRPEFDADLWGLARLASIYSETWPLHKAQRALDLMTILHKSSYRCSWDVLIPYRKVLSNLICCDDYSMDDGDLLSKLLSFIDSSSAK